MSAAVCLTCATTHYQVGLLLLYNFYAWPLGSRPRVAQVLVLPPMQGGGAGKALLRAAYGLAAERGAVDLTVNTQSVCLPA